MSAKKTAATQPEMFVVTETYSVDIDGASIVVHKGQVLPKGDQRLRSPYYRTVTDSDLIEQATAGPGEHREVTW